MSQSSDTLIDDYIAALLRECGPEEGRKPGEGPAAASSRAIPLDVIVMDAQGKPPVSNRLAGPARTRPGRTAAYKAAVQPAPEAILPLADEGESLGEPRREALQALLSRALPIAADDEPLPAVTEELFAEEPKPELQHSPRLRRSAAKPAQVGEPAIALPLADVKPSASVWNENGRPHWAKDKFDALLFRVNGLAMAVPLVTLGQIHPLSQGLTPLFGQAKWFMGLLPCRQGQIRVVNTALFVMPERYSDDSPGAARYVISIADLDWGLAVDSVDQPLRLKPEDVTWRGERSKRPWLAGTVKSALCALIDIPQMGLMLQQADRNATRRP